MKLNFVTLNIFLPYTHHTMKCLIMATALQCEKIIGSLFVEYLSFLQQSISSSYTPIFLFVSIVIWMLFLVHLAWHQNQILGKDQSPPPHHLVCFLWLTVISRLDWYYIFIYISSYHQNFIFVSPISICGKFFLGCFSWSEQQFLWLLYLGNQRSQ